MDYELVHEGITYKFSLLTIGQEDEWRDWVRGTAMREAMEASDGWPMDLRAKYLAEVSKSTPKDKCSFLGEYGQQILASEAGLIKVLSLASRKHHPEPVIPNDVLKKLIDEKTNECGEIMIKCLPISETARNQLLDGLGKKVGGQMAGR